ncbi:hypothetical protein B0I00_2579 [Novosphingobium kunmingense]|uniref:Sulfotransferase family protein n=1 Tax=Novosphingobium kunmingense TaxID=1211806 RepID=A0A2N0H4U2_9SPHN|nr:hypothetical protein [Novosphingobium kunmingense]PKB13951.1 hypothetical protein B0I00_2579 [Novosphingobium kunmingense]
MAAPIDLANAETYAHRFVESADAFRFIAVARGELGGFPFLTDAYLGERAVLGDVPTAQCLAECGTGNLRLLFHSAFCGSTLLTRAFDRPGLATGLSEPVALNDLVGWRRRGAVPAGVARAADAALRLLARPFAAGEAVIVKPSNVVNPLAELLLAVQPTAPALFLYAPIETFLISVARKGLECRLWVRELLEGYLQERFVDLGFSPQDLFRQSDLQVAAVGWLAQHAHFARLAQKLGPMRLRTLDADLMAAAPAKALAAVARHYRFDLDEAALAAIVSGPAFTRHSKSGEAYSPEARGADYRRAREAYGDEIAMVAAWAARVADGAGIALDAPNPVIQA